MFIEDLSTECYFASGSRLRAIGWLEQGQMYQQGSVTQEFLERLRQHVAQAYQPVLFMGPHRCSLCPTEQQTYGIYNLLIPTRELLYIAPALILHYVEQHGYRPPDEFIAAVMACPGQETQVFMQLLNPFQPSWEGPR